MSLDSFFKIKAHGSTVAQEVLGGASTYTALSYIIFVQPLVLSLCGMDPGAVMLATCICSAAACLIMGLWANLPIALAPAMGHNFFFALIVCGPVAQSGLGLTWPEALAANFIAGVLFLAISLAGLRQVIMNAIPESLKYAIAAGIGLLIAFIGLQWSGIVIGHPVTYVTLGSLKNPVTLLSIFGLLTIAVLSVFKVRAAILIGMVLTAGVGYAVSHFTSVPLVKLAGETEFPNISATFGHVFGGFPSLFSHGSAVAVMVIFTFLLLDVFDTIGTLVGLGQRAGLMKDGQLPNAKRALAADALGTILGTIFGTSTITSYIESAAGIAAGARTGLAAVTTAVLFLLSIVAYPLIAVFGTAVTVPAQLLGGISETPINCYPVIAPVLIIIGCYMLPMVKHIDWDDLTEAIPAFLTFVVMQFSFSITDGIAWGFIAYAALKTVTGNCRRCPITVYVCSVLFIIHYALR